MKLSLVIPTRERAEYLASALHSALEAADNASCPVEIIVSDNASQDETPRLLGSITDPRIVVLRSERRLSMRENFEFALAGTTGSHIVFVGDDDAVLPNGLRILARLIAAEDPDIVKWRVLNYLWPDPAGGGPGRLKFRPLQLDGRVRRLDPRAVLQRFGRARFRSYHEGGMIYHGCISRRLIDRVVSVSEGPYFRGSSPDVFTSLQALMVTDRPMVKINLPLTLGGASPRSNGAAGQKAAVSGTPVAGSEFSRFVAESERDPYQCKLPAACQSLGMVTLDCLQSAAALHGSDVQIDTEAWKKRIAADIAGFAQPARHESLDLAREVFGMEITVPPHAGLPNAQPQPEPPGQAARDNPENRATQTRLRHSPASLVYSGGDIMSDSAKAAGLLDQLLGLDQFDKPGSGVWSALIRVWELHTRARKLGPNGKQAD
jgi:hypothetical protein